MSAAAETTSVKGRGRRAERRGERLEARVSSEVMDSVRRAASVQGQTVTDFVVSAANTAAQRVLLDQVFFSISEEKFRAFEAALEAPLFENESIKKLLASKSPWE